MKPKYCLVRVRASRRRLIPSILAAALAFALGEKSVHAQTWNQTAAGTAYQWSTTTNWTPNTVPNSTTAIANVNNNITGAQTINLATGTAANRTVNDLNLGDSDATHAFTIAQGVAGSVLIFGGTGPTLDITGNSTNTISAGIRFDANATFRSNGTAQQTISGAITNDGTVRNLTFNNDLNGTVTAAGTNQGQFQLSAANTFGGTTGTVSISDVRVASGTAGAFGANAANTVTMTGAGQMYLTAGTHVNNVILNSTGWVETAGNLGALRVETGAILNGTVTMQANSIVSSNSGNGTLGGAISGAFNLTKVGAGTLILNAANNYSGTTTISAGTLRLANTGAVASSTGITMNTASNSLVFGTDTAFTTLPTLTGSSGAFTYTLVSDRTTAGAGLTHALGTGSFGNATFAFTAGSNVNSGTAGISFTGITLAGGTAGTATLAPGTGASVSIGTVTTSAAAKTMALDGTGTGTITGIISDGTSLVTTVTKANTSTWTLSGANTYTGTTTVSAGTLRATNSASSLGAGALSLGVGTLQLANDSGLNFGRNTTVTGNATISSDTLTAVAGVNHTLGTLSIGAQTLSISKGSNATGTTAGITFGAVTQTGASVFNVGTDATLTLGALQTTAQNITKQGVGTLVLGTAANAARVAGTNTLTAGTMRLGSVSALGTTGATLALNGGILDLATNTTVNAYNTTVGGTTTINSNRSSAGAGITHTLGTLSIGAHTLNVTRGANSTSGTGTVTFGTTTLTGNATFAPAANAQLNLGAVGGAFTLTKDGAGLAVLTAASGYTGATTVSAGTLRVTNATALGTNATVTLAAAGSTLELSGTINTGSGKTVTLNTNTTGDLRSTLLNGANNNTWAGNVVLAGTGFAQISAASGTTLTITGNLTSSGAAGTGTMAVRGVGTIILNGNINLGTERAFTHTDSGTAIVNTTGNTWTRAQVSDGQIQIGINNALDTGKEFTFGQSSATNGRLELNGFNQTLTRLNSAAGSTGTNHILRNSSLTTASTLTFATPTATTDTATNLQIQGTATGLGTLHMVSNGLGRTEFNGGLLGANSWTVNTGTVAFTGTNNRVLPGAVTGLAAATIEKAGASTLTATSTWNNAGTTNVTGGTLVLGAGTAGAVNVSDGATLSTGRGGSALSSTAVTFGSAGATTYAPILTAPAVAAPLNAGSLTLAGTTVTVAPQATSFSVGTYRMLDYTGTIGGTGSFALGAVGTYPHITATLDTATSGEVNLVVSATDSLIWAGQTNGTWDVNTTSNFALASSSSTGATFYQGDAVAFGDTHDVGAPGTPVTNSTITGGAITIGNLTFNNTAVNYSVANNLSGAGGISKSGTGSVTLLGINTYSGVTSVNNGVLTLSGANLLGGGAVNVTGGTLRIGNSEALRGAGAITVSGGGTFDANGTAVGARYPELIVSGAGVGGNGAIVNNGAALTNNSHFNRYTLTGNTTWGGSARYDLVAGQTFNAGSFTLTKTGTGDLWYNPDAGSVLENVIVNQGVFGSQQSNPLSTTATVTVNTGGQHQIWATTSQQHRVELNDGGILRKGDNTVGTMTGQVTLNGTTAGRNIQAATSGTLNIAGKITGTGGFTVNEAGTVQLQNATNDYAGNTVITLGTLNFNATGIIPTTTNLIIDGGTFATGNIARTVGSLSGVGGTISGGNVLTTTQSSPTVWEGVLNSTTAQMSGSGSLTLGGIADNNSGIAIVNSGTLILAKGNVTTVNQNIHSVGGGGNASVTVNGGTLQLGGTYNNTTSLGTGDNAAPAGINTATYVDQIFNAVGVALNAGTFDLNGRQEALNTLTNPGGIGGTLTNTSAAPAKLYIGHLTGTSSFGGAIVDGTGTVAVEKIGTGSLTLSGANNFSGGLTQTAGTVIVNPGATLGNTPITVTANTFTFDGTHGSGAIAVNGTSVFAGAGTSGGTLTAATGTTVSVGTASAGTSATTLTLGGLSVSGGVNINLDFNTAGTTVDKIATTVSNGLTLNGANNLNVVLSGAGWVSGTYPIFTYTGALGGTGTAALTLTTPVGHSTVNIVDDTLGTVNLVVTGAANKWVGDVDNTWDTNNTLNWNSVDEKFLTGDSVVFDDTATTFTPNILANQSPAGVTFDNTTAQPYSLTSTGAFGIAGTGGLIKKNTGTVTISSANTYTGTTDVQQGALIANFNTGTAQTVFAAASVINVANGATLRAVANDADVTLANNLTGSGLVVIDPHFTAAAAVRAGNVTGNNVGFTGTLRLSPTVLGDGLGTFRTATNLTPAMAGGATIDVDAGAQAWLAAGTFPNNFTITGHGYAEAAGATPAAASGLTPYSGALKAGIGAFRMNTNTIISGNVTLDGSAKIGPYSATGIISGSIFVTNPTDILSVGGTNAAVTSTLVLTGTNNVGSNALNQIVVNAGGTSGTNVLQIGNLGTTGTLGTGNVTLYNDAAGARLVIQRSDGYTMAQNVTAVHNGTASNLTRSNFVSNTQGTGVSLNGRTIDLTDGTNNAANAGGVFVGGVTGGSGVNNAVLNVDGASVVKTGTFFMGDAAGFSGTVNQSGTSDVQVASHVRVSHYGTNTSAYNISAGTLTIANINTGTDPSGGGEQIGGIYLGVDGTGTMTQSGGTVTTDWIVLDNRGDTPAGTNMPDGIDRYNLSAGTLILRSQWGITQRNTSTAVALSGGTIRNGGTDLQVRLDIAPDVSGLVTLDNVSAGNSFNLTRSATGAGSLALLGGGTLRFTTTTTQNIAVPVTGAASVEKLGVGITTLSSANTYDGTTTITAGTLQMGTANALPSGTGKGDVVFSAAGTSSVFDINGNDTSINGLSQNSISTANLVVNNATGTNKTLTLGNNNVTATFGGIIANNTSGTGTLALTKVGTGTQNLTGTNTFTGAITVNGGLIGFASSPTTNGPLGNSTVVNLNGGGLSYIAAVSNHPLNRSVVIGAGDGTLDVTSVAGGLTLVGANVSSTGGNLIKTGLGAVTISGTTTLNGGAAGVEVNGGTLQAGFGASGISTIEVGATGTLSLQNSAIETLTLGNTTGALTLAGGARLGFEFDGATNDRINVGATGTASLTPGVITLDLLNFGAGITAGNTYTLLSAPAGDLTGGGLTSYVIGAAPSGFNYSLNVTATSVTLTVVSFSPAYWTNSQSTDSWSTLNTGPLSNFSTLATGGVNTAALPGTNETVFFSENGVAGPIVTSTLDGNFTINSLNFVAGSGTVTATNVNQGSSGVLTIQPFTGLGGIDVGANAGAATIGAPVVASSVNSPTQTWNVDGSGANGSSLTLNGVVTFNASVIKSGAGTLTLGNAGNTGSGNFTLSAGTLALTATGNMPTGVLTIGSGTTINNAGAGTITLAHSAYTWNGNFTQSGQSLNLGTGAVTLGASVVTTVPANTLTVGGGIDDGALTFGLTKADAGTLVLNGNNGYDGVTTMNAGVLTLAGNNSGAAGGVTLNAGVLNINSDNALGTGRLTLNGGIIDNTDASPHTQLGNPVQTWTNAVNMTFTGTQALNLGSGDVTLGTDATAGSFTLTNNSALTGTSLTVGGDISAVVGGTAGVKTLTIAGAGSTALTGSITRGSASALDITVTSGATTTLSGAASTIRTLNANGGATSVIDIGAGTLTLSNAGSQTINSTGGTINGTGSIVLSGTDGTPGDNGVATGATLTINAKLTGNTRFEYFSATQFGTFVLNNVNNDFNDIVMNQTGTISVPSLGNAGSNGPAGKGAIILNSNAAVFRYTGTGETSNKPINLSGTTAGGIIDQSGPSGNLVLSSFATPGAGSKTLTLQGSTAGTGEISAVIANNSGTNTTSITKLGSGRWTLSGANTYTGTTTVSEGTLVLAGRGTGTPGTISVSTLAGLSATLEITAGTYNLGAGRMNVGNAATTAATGTVNQSGGAVIFTGGDQVLVGQSSVGTIANQGIYNLSGGSITTFTNTGRGVMLGVNTGALGGTFNLSGTGALNMTAASGGGGNAILQIGRSDSAANNTTNAFNQTGGTANVGILAMGGAAAGSTGVSATLNLTGGTFAANSFTLMSAGGTNTSIINIGGSAAVTLPTFPTNAKGAGSTATITFDSTTGFLSPLAASATYMPAATFDNAYLTANGAKFNVGSGNDITIAQVLRDAVSPAANGTLTKSGAGVLTLSAANTYSGATTINAGTLSVAADNNLGTAPVAATPASLVINGGTLSTSAGFTLNSNRGIALGTTGSTGGTIAVAASTTLSYGGIIANNGGTNSLTKTGAGTLVLSGANTYSGATTISAGALNISAADNLGDGSATNTISLGAATLRSTGGTYDLGANRDITLTGGGTAIVRADADTLTLSGDISLGGNRLDLFGNIIASGVIDGTVPGTGNSLTIGSATVAANVTLSGNNTFAGNVSLPAANTDPNSTLTVTNSGALGVGPKTVQSLGGGEIHLQNNITLPVGVNFRVSGNSRQNNVVTNRAVIYNDSGNNTIQGNITLAPGNGGTTISSDSGLLTINGSIAPDTTLRELRLRGNGNGIINGAIANGGTVDMPVFKDVGTGTWTFTGANTYTGATTVSVGTLALVGGSQASPITVSAGASLGFTLGSPTTSTSTFNLTNGTIKITGTPTLPSYTLITDSAGITGTPVLDAPIAGYFLKKVGNSLILTSPLGLFDAWTDATYVPPLTAKLKTDDQDGDGFINLMEYAFGTEPTVSSTAPLAYSGGVLTSTGQPILVQEGGVWYAVFGRRKDYVEAGLTYTVEFSSGLSEWVDGVTAPTVIATDGTIDAVRVPFPNFIDGPSGPQKPTFFRVEVSSSF